MIQERCVHFCLTFKNGYTISVFSGFESYSENHSNTNSKRFEIAVIYNNELVTSKIIDLDYDSVYGYVISDELADIIYKVKNIKK